MGMTLPAVARDKGGPELPPPSYGDPSKCDPAKLREWQDSRIPYTHPYRMRMHSLNRKADLFDQSVQWLIKSYNSDPTRTVHWARMEFRPDDPSAIPTPTYNEFSGPLENEAARLGRPEYEPYVRAKGEKPDLKTRTAAKLAEKVLKDCLEQNRWNEQADMGELHMPLYGGWFLLSTWETSWRETVRVPVLTAQKCPACDFTLADKDDLGDSAAEMAMARPDVIQRTPVDDPKAPYFAAPKMRLSTNVCLTCEDHEEMVEQETPVMDDMTGEQAMDMGGNPVTTVQQMPMRMPGPPSLEPFTPVKDELQAKDYFGRDLGQDVPLGRWRLKTLSPYDVFLENLGIDHGSIEDVPEFTYVHVENIDWICDHYANGYLVEPEDSETLLKYHPIGGERAIFYAGATTGYGLFRNHARVKETHRKPWMEPEKDAEGHEVKNPDGSVRMKRNKGRTLIMAGNVVLFDGDYLIESKTHPGVTMPRAILDYSAWKLRSGGRELLGVSMSEGLFDAQENINEVKSQIQDARQHEGSPRWLLEDGMDLDYDASGEAGAQWIYRNLDGDPNRKPQRIESALFSAEVYKESESDIDYMNRHANLNEVEGGNVPDNVAAALALQFLAEQSGERRRPRIRRIREMLMRAFRHGLDLMHELVREPREYWDRDDRNEWAQKSWDGMQLLGQTDVRIDAEPESDTDVQEQQRIQDAINLKIVNPANPRAARIIAKRMKVPQDLYEEENLQDESAEREFAQFMDEDIEPVVDSDLDSPQAHAERHGIDLHSEKWRDLANQAGYSKVAVLLAGWEQRYDTPAPPPPMVDPATNAVVQQPTVPGMNEQAGAAWPPLEELRIFQCWQVILSEAKYQPKPEEMGPLKKYLRARAHYSAHRRAMTAQAAATQAGQQVAAAPEAAAAADGTVPEAMA